VKFVGEIFPTSPVVLFEFGAYTTVRDAWLQYGVDIHDERVPGVAG